jgi:hypothetical protein
MSGVFSMASQAALQYLPVVASQLQTGCAHFFAGSGDMYSSCFDRKRTLLLHHRRSEKALLSI